MYKHDENTIDPQDKHLVTYVKGKRKWITEASSLQANGISPTQHHYTIGGIKKIIYLWSERYKLHICYRHSHKELDTAGEVMADVYTPYWGIISGGNETLANQASLGTQLVILND